MPWVVVLDDEFEVWLDEQPLDVRKAIARGALVLKEMGPTLPRPWSDTIKGSAVANLKELRVQHKGQPWRVLYAFDPARQAVLLVGGNKASDKRWYDTNVPIAEARAKRHGIS